MKIIADENMPLVDELFGAYGDIQYLAGRAIKAVDVKDADVLLVRSITQVNQSLLAGSSVKFVGSATIGVDHVDLPYLEKAGITFANAPGCNAEGVVQYVFSALCRLGLSWQGKRVGIIGCGNVGGRLHKKLRSMGVECLCYDPFLTSEQNSDLGALNDALQCDIISMHTPYTTGGDYPTHHLINADNLSLLKHGAVLINAGRGAAINNMDLLSFIESRPDMQVVLDVWEHEPYVDEKLLSKVKLATPHIAGYSKEGKENGTRMVRVAFFRWQGLTAPVRAVGKALIQLQASSAAEAVLSAYDVAEDDQRTRRELTAAGDACGERFDQLRKSYPVRPEFSNYQVAGVVDETQAMQLRCLGFTVN
jgi:erythronate-4-phosphate dehydrogenase